MCDRMKIIDKREYKEKSTVWFFFSRKRKKKGLLLLYV